MACPASEQEGPARVTVFASDGAARVGGCLFAHLGKPLLMRHGKDFMVDKPGMTTLAQLAAVREAQRETGRIYLICYSEHFATRSTVRAGELVSAGAYGRQLLAECGTAPRRRCRRADASRRWNSP